MKTHLILSMALLTGLFSCVKNNDSALPGSGVGGSLARFTITGNYLYTVSNETLTTYDITEPVNPVQKNEQKTGFIAETIFPYRQILFVGGRTGMYIYDISHPDKPKKLGVAEHLQSCDPVVANDSTAFVTLRSGTQCSNATDALYVYDVRNPARPKELFIEKMDHPEGLGLQDSTLFVCDSTRIIVMNVEDPNHPVRTDTLSGNGEIFHDVIPDNSMLICTVKNDILLYDIADVHQIRLLAKINH